MTRVIGPLLAGALALTTLGPAAWAQPVPGDRYPGMHWMWGTWGMAMAFGMLLFWALLVTAIVLTVRWLVRVGGPRDTESPIDILKRRYARGEIGRDEYDAARQELR